MLGHLTKHEMITIGKIAFPSYIAILIVSAIGRLLTWVSTRQYFIDSLPSSFISIIDVLATLISTVLVIAFVSLVVLTLVFMIYRFYKNFFTDEGYLMMTLPVRPGSLVFSKLFNTWIFMILSAIVCVLSMYISLGHFDVLQDLMKRLFEDLKIFADEQGDFFKDYFGVPLWGFILEIVLSAFIAVNSFILSWYASVGFGMLISKKHKILGTIVANLVINIALTILLSVFIKIITAIDTGFLTMFEQEAAKAIQLFIIGSGGINLIFGALLFAFITYMMTHKLNLD